MKALSILLAMFFYIQSQAASHEIKRLAEILSYVDSETLVVFDIDNTLAESPQTIGSVQWQEFEVEKAKTEGLSNDQALERSIRKFIAVNYQSLLKPVEDQTSSLVKRIQMKSAGVLALTARPVELLRRTHYLLDKIDIHLPLAAPLGLNVQTHKAEQAVYVQGILAVGPRNDKGEMLKWLISQPGFSAFKSILFVDDKLKYTQSIEKALNQARIPNHVFRYGGADTRVQSFDPQVAERQTHHFESTGQILKD